MSERSAAVTVRPAEVSDAAELYRLSVAAILGSAAGCYDDQQLQAWAGRRSEDGHRRLVETTATVVALVGDEVAGFAGVALRPVGRLRAGEVDQLFVDPRHGGRGVARALLAAVDAAAREAGLTELTTHASWRAVPVFERCGYRCVRVESVEVAGVVLTRAAMRRDVPAG